MTFLVNDVFDAEGVTIFLIIFGKIRRTTSRRQDANREMIPLRKNPRIARGDKSKIKASRLLQRVSFART